MTEEAKKAMREYNRKYYAEHKEEAKLRRARYWEKKAAKLADADGKTPSANKGDDAVG